MHQQKTPTEKYSNKYKLERARTSIKVKKIKRTCILRNRHKIVRFVFIIFSSFHCSRQTRNTRRAQTRTNVFLFCFVMYHQSLMALLCACCFVFLYRDRNWSSHSFGRKFLFMSCTFCSHMLVREREPNFKSGQTFHLLITNVIQRLNLRNVVSWRSALYHCFFCVAFFFVGCSFLIIVINWIGLRL